MVVLGSPVNLSIVTLFLAGFLRPSCSRECCT
jgi:hypothetical protein